MYKNVNTILWDWNGTLLNDRDLCIRSMNRLLSSRNLPFLTTEKYLEVFTFPVKLYYQKLGFNFQQEAFEIPAEEFITHYSKGLSEVLLFDDVVPSLDFFQKKGFRQYIISAMEHNALRESVKSRGILPYFKEVYGIADNLAHGKISLAEQLLKQEKIRSFEALLIGDTQHDVEVAEVLQVQSVLVARGHQHTSVLQKTGKPIMESLSYLHDLF